MKRILTLILGLLFVGNIAAMEVPNATIALEGPIKNSRNNHYHFYAKIDGKDAGEISYKCRSRFEGTWEIIHLEVKKPFRKQGAASKLFKKCIAFIQDEKGKKIIWEALSYDVNIPIKEIVNFYRKRVQELGLFDQLKMEEPKGPYGLKSVKMALVFNDKGNA